jgi:hypothetical protein
MATIRQRKNKSWQGIIRRKGFPHQSRIFKLKSDTFKWVRSVEVRFDQKLHYAIKRARDIDIFLYEVDFKLKSHN